MHIYLYLSIDTSTVIIVFRNENLVIFFVQKQKRFRKLINLTKQQKINK